MTVDMTNDSVHDGHRQRMRERIKQQGVESLQQHEALEYLLYSFVPRKDTNPIAHELINKFGSLSSVLEADSHRLEQVPGMTENAALFLSALPGIFRMYLDDRSTTKLSLKGRAAARSFLGNKLFGVKEEAFVIAALNVHEDLLAIETLSTGTGDSVPVTIRSVVDFALRNNASGILIAHNHPSGNVRPSQSDISLTYAMLATLASISVTLLDHLIFCGSEFYSFDDDGKLNRMKLSNLSFKEGISFYD